MSIQLTKNISISKNAVKKKQGVVVLPLQQWREIEQDLEDLEMYSSQNLADEISKRRKQKARNTPLGSILKKYRI